MPEQNKILAKLRQRPKLVYLVVFIFFLLLHIFIFRGVIAAIPEIIEGKSVLVREELVPIFDLKTQFLSEKNANLTYSEEVRVAYSFWTAWVRHYAVLPFALVIMNALSAFILFYSFQRIGRYFSKDRFLAGALAATLAAMLIHFILLYAKVAHFYTLIIGFSMFALSLSLVLEQFYFKKDLSRRNIIITSLLVLLNPAIHYHIIFYLVLVTFVLLHTIFVFLLSRRSFFIALKRNVLYLSLITLLSLVPYVIYVSIATATSLSSVSTQIPVNYWMIFYTSIPLSFIFSFDIAGHSDFFRYGNYMVPSPRITSMVIMILIISLVFLRRKVELSRPQKALILTVAGVFLMAIWLSVGYSTNSIFSFHKSLSEAVLYLSEQNNLIAATAGQFIYMFISILRFPHRFQFIYFYLGGILLMISVLWLKDILRKKTHSALLASALVVLIISIPIFGNRDYRSAFLSGDFGNLLKPYDIPVDLPHIKEALSHTPSDEVKLFVMPSMESGREIVRDGERFSFIDKFIIYYLNRPTYYYGVGANTANKIPAFLAYRAINARQNWWEDMLVNNLGITHIVEPKNLTSRARGITYMPGIDGKITKSLENSKKFHKVYDGHDYALYEVKQKSDPNQHVLVDLKWGNFLQYFNNSPARSSTIYFPLQIDSLIKHPTASLVTDSVERSFYNLYTTQNKDISFYPEAVLLPFNKSLVASSNFTNNAMSIMTLSRKDDYYNFLKENLPNLINLKSGQFVGLPGNSDNKISLKLKAPLTGNYRIVIHGASREDILKARLDSKDINLNKVKSDLYDQEDYVDLTYFYADVDLSAGKHKLSVLGAQSSIIIESLSVIPAQDVPENFNQIDTPNLQISPTVEPNIYNMIIGELD